MSEYATRPPPSFYLERVFTERIADPSAQTLSANTSSAEGKHTLAFNRLGIEINLAHTIALRNTL
ncbi:MAG: hypothetical protein AAGI44_20290 [Pseudomonadota bacterium]